MPGIIDINTPEAIRLGCLIGSDVPYSISVLIYIGSPMHVRHNCFGRSNLRNTIGAPVYIPTVLSINTQGKG